MKVAVSSTDQTISAGIDPRFGRTKYLLIIDTTTDEYTVFDNQKNMNAAQGAGIQTAQNVVKLKVDAIITGNIGPKAFNVLNMSNIKIYLHEEGSVENAIHDLKANRLKEVDTPTVRRF